MGGGYMGKILRVNLTDKSAKAEPLDPKMAHDFIGGRGFVQKILYDEVPIGADPLGPDNKVVMAPGPLSGVFMPASGKIQFGALSPATGIMGDANMGGHFSAEIKYAGYDAIIIEGMSDHPCIVVIDDDKVEIRDAARYWGKGSAAAEKMIKDDLGEEAASDVDFIMVTFDPERDTEARMKEYLNFFDPEFIGLRGDDAQTQQFLKDYGVTIKRVEYPNSSTGYLIDHTALIYVIDKEGRLRLTYPYGTDPLMIAEDVQHLVKE